MDADGHGFILVGRASPRAESFLPRSGESAGRRHWIQKGTHETMNRLRLRLPGLKINKEASWAEPRAPPALIRSHVISARQVRFRRDKLSLRHSECRLQRRLAAFVGQAQEAVVKKRQFGSQFGSKKVFFA